MIIQKAGTEENIKWVFQMLNDQNLVGLLTQEQCGLRALEGKLVGSNGKGLVDFFVSKRRLHAYLREDVFRAKKLKPCVKEKLKEVFTDVAIYRKYCGYPNQDVDLAWRSGWDASSDEAVLIMEDNTHACCLVLSCAQVLPHHHMLLSCLLSHISYELKDATFGTKHDDCIRQAVRSGRTPEDACETGTLKQALDSCDELLALDRQESESLPSLDLPPPGPQTEEKEEIEVNATLVILNKIKQAQAKTELEPDDETLFQSCVKKAEQLHKANIFAGVIPKSSKKAKDMIEETPLGKNPWQRT